MKKRSNGTYKRKVKRRSFYRLGQQLDLLGKQTLSYGGELLKTRAGRRGPRPLDTRNSIHLVLRSSKAKGDKSFRTPKNAARIKKILKKFADRYHIEIYSMANVGNHLHIHLRLFRIQSYKPFIRAVTASIAMAISGHSRWNPKESSKDKFWDYRPFTRVVRSFKALLTLRDYIQINKLEGFGISRAQARYLVGRNPAGWSSA